MNLSAKRLHGPASPGVVSTNVEKLGRHGLIGFLGAVAADTEGADNFFANSVNSRDLAAPLSVGLTHWPVLARIVRGELLSLRERPFVAAAIGGGATRMRLMVRHFLPHLAPATAVGLVLLLPHAIFHESALSFGAVPL